MKNKRSILGIVFILLVICSCEKMIDVDPPIDKIIGDEIYSSNSGAISVLTGIYTDLSKDGLAKGKNSISVVTGLYSDELSLFDGNTDVLSSVYANNLTNVEPGLWSQLYAYIFRVNSAITGISASSALSKEVKNQLLGEAKFLRSFFYFYLINLYGPVPLLLSTDISKNSSLGRTGTDSIYQLIVGDLKESIALLNEDYLSGNLQVMTADRLRPNKSAAKALLARVYLYNADWANAETIATEVLSNSKYSLNPDVNQVFNKTSNEIIWALQPTTALGLQKTEAGFWILTNGPNISHPVYLSHQIIDSFELDDKRAANWINLNIVGSTEFLFPYKYKDVADGTDLSEYAIVLRISEQYLIRAEARAHLGKLTGATSALTDVNIIRERAGLSPAGITSQADILSEILRQRKFELFTEWGHRWFDLRRSSDFDKRMSRITSKKGGNWASYKQLFPIPVSDIQRNPNLKGHQNPGYPES